MPPTYPLKAYAADASILQIGSSIRLMSWGGFTFEEGRQERGLEADGLTTPMSGTRRTTGWMSSIRFRMKDFGIDSAVMLQPGSSSDGSASNNAIQAQDARQVLTDGDMLQDVRLIYRVIDPITQTDRYDALVIGLGYVEPWTQQGEDTNEQTREVSILAMLPAAHSPNNCPFVEIQNYDEATFDIDDYFTITP